MLRIDRVGKFFEFDLTRAHLETIRKQGAFDILSGVLAKTESARTGLEAVVVKSMWRLARGVVSSDPAEKFLNLAIALESMMIETTERGTKFDKMSRRLAAFIEVDAGKRPPLDAWARTVYSRRNEHVHAAAREAPLEQVLKLEGYTLAAFIKMAQQFSTWNTHMEFVAWADATARSSSS